MYKTIRHGENSLQYTILPQNDDFRIEGKLSSAGSNSSSIGGGGGGGGGSTRKSKSKSKRTIRRSFFAYLGFLFVCTVIVGAVVIPFLVSAECLPNPAEWFRKTKAAFTSHSQESAAAAALKIPPDSGGSNGVGILYGITRTKNIPTTAPKTSTTDKNNNYHTNNSSNNKSNNNTSDIINAKQIENSTINSSYPQSNITNDDNNKLIIERLDAVSNVYTSSQNITLTNGDKQNQLQSQVIDHSSTIDDSSLISSYPFPTTTAPQGYNFVAEVRLEGNRLTAVTPSIVVTTLQKEYNDQNPLHSQKISSATMSPTSTTPSTNQNAPAVSTIMTRIIQVPLLKSSSKKLIIPPVLAKTNSRSLSSRGDNRTTNSDQDGSSKKKNSNWIHTHWAYIDPSTYFQWTGYKTEDSVLLPALLGIALIGIIFIITLCLIARNKRTIVSSVRKRNRNDIEETGGEDNATLLTSTNLSDED